VVFCSIWFRFVSFDLKKPISDMTYNVFGGTLSLTQSINQSFPKSAVCVYVCV